jgi:hypothetical protein
MENRCGVSFPLLSGSGAKTDVLENLKAISTFD